MSEDIFNIIAEVRALKQSLTDFKTYNDKTSDERNLLIWNALKDLAKVQDLTAVEVNKMNLRWIQGENDHKLIMDFINKQNKEHSRWTDKGWQFVFSVSLLFIGGVISLILRFLFEKYLK